MQTLREENIGLRKEITSKDRSLIQIVRRRIETLTMIQEKRRKRITESTK